jgi:hypothetical protein
MTRLFISLMMLFFGSLAYGLGGQDVGNGGDVLICKSSPQNQFNGAYVLDFVASYYGQPIPKNEDAHFIKTLWENLYQKSHDTVKDDRATDIHLAFTAMAQSLYLFYNSARTQVFAAPDFKNGFIWMAQPFGLVDIQDENLAQQIPDNCKVDVNGELKVNLVQAIVREDKGTSSIYRYDPGTLKNLKQSSEYQFSYLLVHEWLRGAHPDSRELRDINMLLHSQDFLQANSIEAAKMLSNLSGKTEPVAPVARMNVPNEMVVIAKDFSRAPNKNYSAIAGFYIFFDINGSQIGSCMTGPTNGRPLNPVGFCEKRFLLESGDSLWGPDGKKLLSVDVIQPDFSWN